MAEAISLSAVPGSSLKRLSIRLCNFRFSIARRFAVERDDMNQQRGRGETIVGLVERAVLRIGRDDIGNELAKSVEHRGLCE